MTGSGAGAVVAGLGMTPSVLGAGGAVVAAVVVLLLVVVVVTAAVLVARARRLDRLHVRTDAATAGLVAALGRRAAVVRAVAATAGPLALAGPERRALRSAARTAEAAGTGADREVAENDLARQLVALDPAALPGELAAELADAHLRVAVARRVHNDAVRDTRALRSRRMVRYLRLAGTAPIPRYFEIAEPAPAFPADSGDGPGGAGGDTVRVVVTDPDDRVLLRSGADPDRPAESFWSTPGGPVGAGEDPREAAVGAVLRETGLVVTAHDLEGPLWTRATVRGGDGGSRVGRELFFLVAIGGPVTGVGGYRWWTVAELAATVDVIHPHQLARLLADPAARRVADPPPAIH